MSWLLPSVPPAIKSALVKERRRRYHKEWREENRERINAYWRKYYKLNRDKRRAYLNRRQNERRAAQRDIRG